MRTRKLIEEWSFPNEDEETVIYTVPQEEGIPVEIPERVPLEPAVPEPFEPAVPEPRRWNGR